MTRSLRASALGASALAAFVFCMAIPSPLLARDAVRTASQDIRGATFEITPDAARFDTIRVDGAAYVRVVMRDAPPRAEAGKPALPIMMIPVAVPDDMTAKVRVASADWEERSGLPPPLPIAKQRFVSDDPKTGPVSEMRNEPDPAIYGQSGTYPRLVTSLGDGGPVGEMWMMPLSLYPVRYDFGKRRYSILKRMTVRVEFVPATAAQLKLRPATRPGADVGPWQKIQKQMIRNYESARMFPRRTTAAMAPRLAPRARVAGNPEFRVSVTTTGWSSVSFASLSAVGFPSGIPIAQVGVWERGYDDVGDSATSTPIPVVARDANTNGIFDAGDAVTFYARKLRDRMGPLSIENRYSYANVYWVTWTGAPATVPGSISGTIADPSPALPTWFHDTIHLEQNVKMLGAPNSLVGTPRENVENFFWTSGFYFEPDAFSTAIPFLDPDTSQPFRVQARYQGRITGSQTHHLRITFVGNATDTLASDHVFFDDQIYVLDTGFTIPGGHIAPSNNQYAHVGWMTTPGVDGSNSLLDWIDVSYPRKYLARSNALEFTSGSAAGIAELHVGGFTQPGVEVYDITNPDSALQVMGVTVTATGPGAYEAVFRTDATAGERRFVAIVTGSEIAIAGSAVVADTPSNLRTPSPFPTGAFARSIMIAPYEFLTSAERLANFRRGQGYVVEVATIQDVYDEFSGGVKSATAIRRYLQHGYDAWTPRPSFAALLGDASLDYRHDLGVSAVDWIPTYVGFEAVYGLVPELVAQDNRFVLNLAGAGTQEGELTPNMFLGRVPASSATELDQYVTKLIQYENFQPTDFWRGRQLLVSDDEYSTSIFFNQGYCFQSFEYLFRQANLVMADTTAASQSGSDIATQFFDLKGFTDPLEAECSTGANCRSQGCVSNAFRRIGGAVDSFQTELAKSGFLVNVEAHANRKLIAHEQIYNLELGDLARVSNVGRPFVYAIWGCHANQFADAPSGVQVDPVDALAEQWVTLPDGGAVGGLGSTALELIDTNYAMNGYFADALYSTPPAPAPAPGQAHQARWILGEIAGQAFVRNANSGFFLQQAMNTTVTLLGDPMIRMDALPPRLFETTLEGVPVTDASAFTSDSPTDSVSLVARSRDEAGLKRTDLVERSVPGGVITPIDSTRYTVTVSDTGRAHTLTAEIRPRIGNYDLVVRSFDRNNRESDFSLQVRSTVRYLANDVVIVNGVFVVPNTVFRAEVTTPIPVTADSLTLLLDGIPIQGVSETAMDATGRHWALVTPAQSLLAGTHTLDVEVNGRLGIFPQSSVAVGGEFTMRGVVVVSQRMMGAGCDGSVFQFELSSAAPKVELMLLTVAGRRVASLQWPGRAGFNVYCWDGRDSRGNETATGLYFYRLTATDVDGHRISQSGRMIRSR